MKTVKKVFLFLAVSLIAVGVIIGLVALIYLNFDFNKLSSNDYTFVTTNVEESFENIDITAIDGNVNIEHSSDNTCKVICGENKIITHKVTVENDTLCVKYSGNDKWYKRFGLYWNEKNEVTVLLPENEYKKLNVTAQSGNINVSENFAFSDSQMSLKSGNITLNNVKFSNGLDVKTKSGNINLNSVYCKTLTADAISGNINLNSFDADEITATAKSGNIFGQLLSEKVFITETKSGDIKVPESLDGGKCKATTKSGNIEFEIVK